MDFKSFKLHPQIQTGVEELGYVTPTPIQLQAIPTVMSGQDVMGLAQTGTGKTAAFGLPMLHRLMQGERGVLRAVVIAPTRELAEQINDALNAMGKHTRFRSITVYGGVNINTQMKSSRRGCEIVVACPGRLLDHISQGTVEPLQGGDAGAGRGGPDVRHGLPAGRAKDPESAAERQADAPFLGHHARKTSGVSPTRSW